MDSLQPATDAATAAPRRAPEKPGAPELWQPIATLPAGALALWGIVHSIRTRTPEDFLRYSLYIALPLGFVVLVVLLVEWKNEGFRRPSAAEIAAMLFVGPLALMFLGATYYAIFAAIKDAYFWLQSPSLSRQEGIVGAIVVTLVAGALLFYFRLRLRSVYGLTEALAGVAVAAHRVATQAPPSGPDTGFYLAILTAGVYLVVRGFDNIHQGLTKPPLDPVATWLLQRLKELEAAGREPGKPAA